MIISRDLVHMPFYKKFKERVGDLAMEYIVRLHGYCEADKRGENLGQISESYLEEICEWKGEPGVLAAALLEPFGTSIGFVTIEDGEYHVVGWSESNARLVSKWNNGGKGGRPKTSPKTSKKPQSADQETTKEDGFPPPKTRKKVRLPSMKTENDFGSPPPYPENELGCRRGDEMRGDEMRGEEYGGEAPPHPPGVRASEMAPSSLEEVVSFGQTCMPPISTERCVQFWAHYEGQAVSKNGNRLWVSSTGSFITNWKARLRGWAVNGGELDQKNTARESAAVSARLTSVERRLREIGDGNAETVVEKLRLQKERADLLQQQKGCVPNVKDK